MENRDKFLLLPIANLKIEVEKSPLRLIFIRNGDTLLREAPGIYSSANSEGARFQVTPGEAFYGTGSRSLPINRRGYDLQIYNQAHYGYGKGEPNLNIAIPVMVSSRGYMLYFENHSPGELDIDSGQDGFVDYHAETGTLSYFFITGANTDTLLSQYTQLTGRQPLPPIWALGYIQSRFGYENENQAQSMVENMKNFDWMWAFYQKHITEGVTGWWCDLGEPENHPADMVHAKGRARDIHNLYSLIWAGDIYRNYARVYPNKRLFNLITHRKCRVQTWYAYSTTFCGAS